MSEFIGIVFAGNNLRMVIDPDDDDALNDKAFVTSEECSLKMVKVRRSECEMFAKGFSANTVLFISQNADLYLARV